MTPDEYLKIQETNKKLYEVALNEEQRKIFLKKMIDTEIKFIDENVTPIEINQNILDQSLKISMNPRIKDKADLFSEHKTLFALSEKLSAEDFFDKVSANDMNGNSVDLRELLKDKPEIVQKLCDLFNERLKERLNKQFGNQADLQMFENDKEIGFKRTPESISSPKIEVDNIINRARNFAASQPQQNLEEQHQDTPELVRPPSL